jgi:UDPglucose 6-dehydrogenase
MNVVVLGLWHLGCVTAACCAKHFSVVGIDFDSETIERLSSGHAPLHEPGLDELIQSGLDTGSLRFTSDCERGCANADVLWVTHDTPVNEHDEADVDAVLRDIRRCLPALPRGALVLISSQLPVGTCRLLEAQCSGAGYQFAVSPENLRLGKAISVFTQAERIIVGHRGDGTKNLLSQLLSPFTAQIVWMRPESAEMTKHAINAFLALSITFMNEVSRLCEVTGADAREVEQGLKTESRIGPKAYLSPGGAFAGGTLARDVVTLTRIGMEHQRALDVIPAIKRSNDQHRQWALEKVSTEFPEPKGHTIALLGLTYKPGTNTLRRSSAIELARALHCAGFTVRATDPSLASLPPDLQFIAFCAGAAEAIEQSDAIVVCTEWPQFRQLDWPVLISRSRVALIIDASRFLAHSLTNLPGLRYLTVGSPS